MEEHKRALDEVKELRDNFDVAHYTVSDEALEAVKAKTQEAVQLTVTVLVQYQKYLLVQQAD